MRNSIRTILAFLLIAVGIWSYRYNRPRTLEACLPAGHWEAVSCRERELAVSAEELKDIFGDVTVFRRGRAAGPEGNIMTLTVEIDGAAYLVELDEEGKIAVAGPDNLASTRTHWLEADPELYETLSEAGPA